MGTAVRIWMYSDLDDTVEAEVTETIAIGGAVYELDLSEEQADAMRADFEHYLCHARKTGKSPHGRAKAKPQTSGGATPRPPRPSEVARKQSPPKKSAKKPDHGYPERNDHRTPDGAPYALQRQYTEMRREIRDWARDPDQKLIDHDNMRAPIPYPVVAQWREAHGFSFDDDLFEQWQARRNGNRQHLAAVQ